MVQAAADLEAQGLGGLFVGNRGASNHRGLSDFPTLDQTTRKVYDKMVSKSPAVEQFGDISRLMVKHGGAALIAPLKAFFVVNRAIERGAQHAARGHLLRDQIQEFTGSWLQTLRTSEKAWNEAKRGMTDTPTQHLLLDQAHELLGKYDSWSPTMRAIVQGPAPFLPWMLNAARFVYWTMPVHHSALTAFLTEGRAVGRETWKEQHATLPPGSLKYAISNGKGGWIDLARYGPYGATIPATCAGSGLRDFKKQFYPQARGRVGGGAGQDPFGRTLKVQPTASNPTGRRRRGRSADRGVGRARGVRPVPLDGAAVAREGGSTAYADSTVLHPRSEAGHEAHGRGRNVSSIRSARRTSGRPRAVKPLRAGGSSGLDAADLH
jgi:hypothetical protein